MSKLQEKTDLVKSVSALFVRQDSIYKTLPGVDCWDIERDASKFNGDSSVVCHPPCRAWGRLRTFANPRPGEKQLAIKSIHHVRKNGGVLEHPHGSSLFKLSDMPRPGSRDSWGGFLLGVDQRWFGHKAQKSTILYICGISPKELPPIPLSLDPPSHVVQSKTSPLPHLSRSEREHTPVEFAKWLVDLASRCEGGRRVSIR